LEGIMAVVMIMTMAAVQPPATVQASAMGSAALRIGEGRCNHPKVSLTLAPAAAEPVPMPAGRKRKRADFSAAFLVIEAGLGLDMSVRNENLLKKIYSPNSTGSNRKKKNWKPESKSWKKL